MVPGAGVDKFAGSEFKRAMSAPEGCKPWMVCISPRELVPVLPKLNKIYIVMIMEKLKNGARGRS